MSAAATPVIVRRHALGHNVPHYDLHVTKGHALFIDDAARFNALLGSFIRRRIWP